MLSEHVQFCAIAYCNDNDKTAYDLWNFLESTWIASNEKAIQNVRVNLDSLLYTEGAKWDGHLNQFYSLIAQIAMYNVLIDDRQK